MKNNKRRNNVAKKKGKIKLFTIVISLLIIAFFNQNCIADKQIKVEEITVNKYDTLWDIAKNICDDNQNLNVQNVIIQIKKINGLNNSDIYVGQQLYIPIY